MNIRAVQGQGGSANFRAVAQKSGRDVSFWQDIPLQAGAGLLNFICEIPKRTSAKMEVATAEEHTPIKQDQRDNRMRHYPFDILWNYGLLPQTWEDPDHLMFGCAGDNDPVDVVEVGAQHLNFGEVYKVKPITALPLIDEGKLDWKIVVIEHNDVKAASINDAADLERHIPGELERIRTWFSNYKPDVKFARQQPSAMDETLKIIHDCHSAYQALKSGSRPNTQNLALD